MGLITLTNIEDGQDAVANALNERFGKIVDTVNGNIDSQNLKNNAVTREKIAPQSVTSDKLNITKSIDENGWMVTDYGTHRQYNKRVQFHGGTGFGIKDADNLPVGINGSLIRYAHVTPIINSDTTGYQVPRGVTYGFLDWTADATTYRLWAASTTDAQPRTPSSAIVTIGD